MLSIVASGLSLGVAMAAKIPTHYAPTETDLTNLDAALSEPAVGYYNGSYVAASDYGTYNFCNMPHVRQLEYPAASRDFSLQYVEVLHRHHKRTPYQDNTFPEEDMPLSCSSTQNFYYGHVINRAGENVDIGWNNYQDPANPFAYVDPGFNGLCQFPQISDGGLNDSYYHGVDLFANYHGLGLLPARYNSSLVQYYVTSNVITSQVAGALVAGMYPPGTNDEGVIVNIHRLASDYLEPKYTCDAATAARALILKEDGYVTYLNRSHYLFEELDAISGVSPKSDAWHVLWDHYFDNLAHRLCHGLPLPCNGDTCVTEAQAQTVFRLGDYMYNYWFRELANSTFYSVAKYGAYLNVLQLRLHEARSGDSLVLYRHNIAHDGSVSPLLGALQIEYLRWPGMGAEVVFELWKSPAGDDYIRVLYGGQPLKTSGPLGTLDMVPFEDFDSLLEELVGDNNVVELCKVLK